MATGIQIFKEADELLKEYGFSDAKEIIETKIRFGRNSATNALWEAALDAMNIIAINKTQATARRIGFKYLNQLILIIIPSSSVLCELGRKTIPLIVVKNKKINTIKAPT